VLGKTDEAKHYGELAAEVRRAFVAEYVTPNGRMLSDATTAYSLALQFALLPEERQRRRAGERLVELVRASGYQISTGFAGTPLICDALCSAGRPDAAYRLLLQRECPSWLYPVTMGATTIWERWDSMLPDGTINPGEMTSFNHYALGAVADWMHRVIGGLAPAAPGYRELALAPVPGGGLTHASARHRTPYGVAECAWRRDGDQITITATVPPNTSAVVTLPGSGREPLTVGPGAHRWQYAYGDARPPLTLDSTVGAAIDNAAAWGAVMEAIAELAPGLGFIKLAVMGQSSVPLREAFAGLPMGDRLAARIERAFAELDR
jgi:alpha-L-rhamnosidase